VVGGIHYEESFVFEASFAESEYDLFDFVVGPSDCVEISIDSIPTRLSFNIILKIAVLPFRVDDERGMCS
jgi:hypothetical protein